MSKLNVTKVIDQWGWAYHHIVQEMQRYTSHNIIAQRFNEINYADVDVMYISSPNISRNISIEVIPAACKAKGIKTIGAYSGEVDMKYNESVDLIVTISPQLYFYAKKNYPNTPVVFLPESIDTNFFLPVERPIDRFIPGWAGGPNKAVKRRHLFDYLIYPVKQMCEHGPQYFVQNANLDKMKDFYASIDCFVLPSSTECMPRVVMEAMASGLAVVATDVGAISMLLQQPFIVPVNPEGVLVYEMNKRLEILSQQPGFRKKIGERNREYIEQNFSWAINQTIWDEVFSLLKDGQIGEILKISDNFMAKFPGSFEEAKFAEHITKFEKPSVTMQSVRPGIGKRR